MLGIKRVERSRGEQDDRGFRPRQLVAVGGVVREVRRRLAQGLQQQRRRLGERGDGVTLEQFRRHAGQHAAVLDHAGETVGLREMVRGDEQFPAAVPAHVEGTGVQEGPQRRRQPDRRPLEGRAPEDQGDRHDPGAQDLLFSHVNVLEKALERPQPLPQPEGEPVPFAVREQLRQRVAKPRFLRRKRASRRRGRRIRPARASWPPAARRGTGGPPRTARRDAPGAARSRRAAPRCHPPASRSSPMATVRQPPAQRPGPGRDADAKGRQWAEAEDPPGSNSRVECSRAASARSRLKRAQGAPLVH